MAAVFAQRLKLLDFSKIVFFCECRVITCIFCLAGLWFVSVDFSGKVNRKASDINAVAGAYKTV